MAIVDMNFLGVHLDFYPSVDLPVIIIIIIPITLEILHHFLLFGIPFLEPMVNIMSINLKKKDKNKLEF